MNHLRLAELRKQKGVSQSKLASDLKISRQAYSLYEISKREMSHETLCLLADYFEVSTDYLLGRQEARPSFLNEEERELIRQYRSLEQEGKDRVNNCLVYEVSRQTKPPGVKKSAI